MEEIENGVDVGDEEGEVKEDVILICTGSGCGRSSSGGTGALWNWK
jgi:hypothetical protein